MPWRVGNFLAANWGWTSVDPATFRAVVTPEAWEDAEMRNALAAREVSRVYRLLRRKGVSQKPDRRDDRSVAVRGPIFMGRQVMAFDVLVRIVDGLDVPRGYMGLAYDEVTAQRGAERSEILEAGEPEDG